MAELPLPSVEGADVPILTEQIGDEESIMVEVMGPHEEDDPEQSEKTQLEKAGEETRRLQLIAEKANEREDLSNVVSMVRLRPYQKEAIKEVERHWDSGLRRVLVVLPTGTGKTIVAAKIMHRAYQRTAERTLFLAHRLDLLDQTLAKVRAVAPNLTAGIVQGPRNEMGKRVTIASIDTLKYRSGDRLRQLLLHGPYSCVVIDEAHHAAAEGWKRVIDTIMNRYPRACLMGLTATPARTDATGLDDIFEDVAYSKSIVEMVNAGWLVPPRGVQISLEIDLDVCKIRSGDFVEKQLSKLMNKPLVNQAVVEAWQKFGEDRRMIAFTVDVAHARDLARTFEDNSIPADFVSGETKREDREKLYKNFRDGKLRVLTSCQVLTEGFDDPAIEGVLWTRPTQSALLYTQGIGRSLRCWPSKVDSLVMDCVGNTSKHNLIQLATVFGLEPEEKPEPKEEPALLTSSETPDETVHVLRVQVHGREIEIQGVRHPELRYHWRETPMGWILRVPSIGYYLVAYAGPHDKTHAWVRFHDERPHKKHSPPVQIIPDPIPFDLAYGLVESEADRILNAMADTGYGSKLRQQRATPEETLPAYMGLDDGLSEDPKSVERLMVRDGQWRNGLITDKQRRVLEKMGVKPDDIPTSAGEASDIISVLMVEKDQRYRVPATAKQMFYLRINHIAHDPDITKGGAAQLIWRHKAEESDGA